jgi:hypothetical protein
MHLEHLNLSTHLHCKNMHICIKGCQIIERITFHSTNIMRPSIIIHKKAKFFVWCFFNWFFCKSRYDKCQQKEAQISYNPLCPLQWTSWPKEFFIESNNYYLFLFLIMRILSRATIPDDILHTKGMNFF